MKIGQHWKIFWEVLRKSDIHIFFGHVSDFVHPFTIPSVCISRSIWSKIDYFPILSFDLVKSDWPFFKCELAPLALLWIYFFLFSQIVLFVGILVCLLAIWLSKMLANKPKCWQTNQNAIQTNQNALQTNQNSYKQTKILTNKPKL